MKLYFAPLQGYTEGIYRKAHHEIYGGIEQYYTPFLRLEKGEPRRQDMARLLSDTNEGVPVTPQAIFSNREELESLAGIAYSYGYRSLDLNIGCPFPPQNKLGRGCAMLVCPEVLQEAAVVLSEFEGMTFSLKMRLGLTNTKEWRNVINIINDMPLTHIAVHPRSGVQQYKGELDLIEFSNLLKECNHPVLYNGEIQSCEDIDRVASMFPEIGGIMIGRGLLARPSLAREYSDNCIWNYNKRREYLLKLHKAVYEHTIEKLCGEKQMLSHLIPFWDYQEDEIGRKVWKLIRKATTLSKYNDAINLI